MEEPLSPSYKEFFWSIVLVARGSKELAEQVELAGDKLLTESTELWFFVIKCSGWDLTDAVIVELFSCTIIGVGWTKLEGRCWLTRCNGQQLLLQVFMTSVGELFADEAIGTKFRRFGDKVNSLLSPFPF